MQILTRIVYYAFQVTVWALDAYATLILITALCSWFLKPYNRFMQLLTRIVDPVERPFRNLLDRLFTSGIRLDFSPVLAMIALQLLSRLLVWVYNLLF
ncbi:MAG: YggT family protein [Eubacteriales bacterium]|nr:YggT family protein [Eubacteriales bacterium]